MVQTQLLEINRRIFVSTFQRTMTMTSSALKRMSRRLSSSGGWSPGSRWKRRKRETSSLNRGALRQVSRQPF